MVDREIHLLGIEIHLVVREIHLVGREINLVGRKIPLVGLVTEKCILLGREIHFGWIHWKYERG